MRISDWSSDVCSSDLDIAAAPFAEGKVLSGHDARRAQFPDQLSRDEILRRHAGHRVVEMENKQDRKSVVEGKSVSVRVDIGGRRIIKKKTTVKIERQKYSPRVNTTHERNTIIT